MKPARAWLLARVSTGKRSQDASPRNQLATLREYGRRQPGGWAIVGCGVERESGGTLDRPKLRRAMAAARARRIDVLAVTDLERLGRNVKELLGHADELRALGVRLVLARLGDQSMVDTSTATGRMVFTMFAAMAEFFRNHYREKSMEGQQRARKAGKHIGRPKEALQPIALRLVLSEAWRYHTWAEKSAELAKLGFVQPGRLQTWTGKMRPDRPWPRSTLARLVDEAVQAEMARAGCDRRRAEETLSKTGGENAESQTA